MNNVDDNSNDFKSEILGNNIKNIRIASGFTQEVFSEKLGITPQFLSAVERGVTGISVNTVIKICNITNCSPSLLFRNIIFPNNDSINNLYDQLNTRDKLVIKDFIRSLLKYS